MQKDLPVLWHKQRTKIHLRLGMTLSSSNIVDWRLNLMSKKHTKISFNHIRWIQSISSFLLHSITGNMAPLWKQRNWKSEIPSAELHSYWHVDNQGNSQTRIFFLEWENGQRNTFIRENSTAKEYATTKRGHDVDWACATLFSRWPNGKRFVT